MPKGAVIVLYTYQAVAIIWRYIAADHHYSQALSLSWTARAVKLSFLQHMALVSFPDWVWNQFVGGDWIIVAE